MNMKQVLINLAVILIVGVPCYLSSFFLSKKYVERKKSEKNAKQK